MIIVLPACHHDAKLALNNLEHALRLEEGAKVPFECVLAIEASAGMEVHRPGLLKAAQALFTTVQVFHVEQFRGEAMWPRPQNFMWQRVARRLAYERNPHRWFWWEPDCVPLEKGWMRRLADVVSAQPRPVAGAVTWQQETGHYLAGVAIYPPSCSRLFCTALNAVDQPWDVAAQHHDAILDSTHDISALICHRPDKEGAHFETMADVKRLVPEGSLLYHKCKDGSLAAVLDGRKPEPLGLGSIPAPSIHVQAAARCWQSGIFAFPYEDKTVHFNPTCIRAADGQLLLITRRSRQIERGNHSDLVLWRVHEPSMTASGGTVIGLPVAPGEQWEDPKAVMFDGRLYLACANWLHQGGAPIRQALLRLDEGLKRGERQAWHPSPDAARHEKNWCPFVHDGKMEVVYSIQPHVVMGRAANAPIMLAWAYGEPRGGTPPVRVGGEYISFFHSSLPWRKPKRRYYVGAYGFAAQPPFRVTRCTTEPLLIGSEEDPRVLGGPCCVFPNGADLRDGKWLLVAGSNDEQAIWAQLLHADLERLLVPVELHAELAQVKEEIK